MMFDFKVGYYITRRCALANSSFVHQIEYLQITFDL